MLTRFHALDQSFGKGAVKFVGIEHTLQPQTVKVIYGKLFWLDAFSGNFCRFQHINYIWNGLHMGFTYMQLFNCRRHVITKWSELTKSFQCVECQRVGLSIIALLWPILLIMATTCGACTFLATRRALPMMLDTPFSFNASSTANCKVCAEQRTLRNTYLWTTESILI